MKKHILTFAFTAVSTLSIFAQNNVGINTSSPDASAALDIQSTSKGLLVPRMTLAQRTAIGIEFHHSETLRVGHVIAEHCRA